MSTKDEKKSSADSTEKLATVVSSSKRKFAHKKLNCIDLFCGCGGLSKGFRLAGFNIVGGIDFNESVIKTFNNG